MTDLRMVVEVMEPAARMNMNQRLHWRTRHRLTKLWRHAAYVAACEQLGRTPSARAREACFVRVSFPVRDPGKRRDPENWSPTSKALVDGMVDAGVWVDDDERHVLVLPCRFFKPDGPLAMQPVLIHLIPRAESAIPT